MTAVVPQGMARDTILSFTYLLPKWPRRRTAVDWGESVKIANAELMLKRDGDVIQLVEHRTGTPLTQVRFPCAARIFCPRANFQCRLSYGVRTPPCAIACFNIRTHVKDPAVHVRVR